MVVLLFGLVTIHELTHSRVAQMYGIKVSNITLLPIGGMAMLGEFPRDPRKELVISIVGPLSNVVIAIIMGVGAYFFIDPAVFSSVEAFFVAASRPDLQGTYLYIFAINIALAVFNLLPAFPMDGGRVFRAGLALFMGRDRASKIAVTLGQILAIFLGLAGLFSGNLLLVVVATFIFFGAQAEGSGDQLGRVLGGLKVSQAVNTAIEEAHPEQVTGELAARLFHSYQEDFPVVEDGRVVGILTRDRLISSLGSDGPERPVREVMRREFPVATLDEPVYDAFVRMRTERVKAMPVMEDDRLIGMVSLEDLSEVYALLSAAGPELADRVPSVHRTLRDRWRNRDDSRTGGRAA
jgi:Zn-dependent protease/CBS domain-containing protein